jgi:hypothetical protein
MLILFQCVFIIKNCTAFELCRTMRSSTIYIFEKALKNEKMGIFYILDFGLKLIKNTKILKMITHQRYDKFFCLNKDSLLGHKQSIHTQSDSSHFLAYIPS